MLDQIQGQAYRTDVEEQSQHPVACGGAIAAHRQTDQLFSGDGAHISALRQQTAEAVTPEKEGQHGVLHMEYQVIGSKTLHEVGYVRMDL